jgi:hypothetical protein
MSMTSKEIDIDDDVYIPKGTAICERSLNGRRFFQINETQKVSIDFIFDEGIPFGRLFSPRLVWIDDGDYFEVSIDDVLAVN